MKRKALCPGQGIYAANQRGKGEEGGRVKRRKKMGEGRRGGKKGDSKEGGWIVRKVGGEGKREGAGSGGKWGGGGGEWDE